MVHSILRECLTISLFISQKICLKCSAGSPDYAIMFYLADGIFLLVVVLMCKLNVDVERVETGSLVTSLKKLVRLIDVDVFMLMMLFLGTCWGFLESFLFVFLMELQANSYLLGKNWRSSQGEQLNEAIFSLSLRNDCYARLRSGSAFFVHLRYDRS